MTVTINGQPVELDAEATVGDAVASLGRDPHQRGVAVAVNGEVVPRSAWAETRLGDSDRIEVLTAVAGG